MVVVGSNDFNNHPDLANINLEMQYSTIITVITTKIVMHTILAIISP